MDELSTRKHSPSIGVEPRDCWFFRNCGMGRMGCASGSTAEHIQHLPNTNVSVQFGSQRQTFAPMTSKRGFARGAPDRLIIAHGVFYGLLFSCPPIGGTRHSQATYTINFSLAIKWQKDAKSQSAWLEGGQHQDVLILCLNCSVVSNPRWWYQAPANCFAQKQVRHTAGSNLLGCVFSMQ